MTAALAPRDAERLADLEVTIALGLTTFVQVGQALAEIRESRLYREKYATFEEYCQAKFQMNRTYAHRMIEAATVVGNLLPIGNTAEAPIPAPTNESQARPLASLEPEQQREAWKEATTTAPKGKVTAEHVTETVKRLFVDPPMRATPVIPIRRDVVTETIAAAKAEFRSSDDGRLFTYIDSLPQVPSGIGDNAFGSLHVSGVEILRLHAAFINRAIARSENAHASA